MDHDEAAQAVLDDAALAARDAFDARLYAAVRMLRSTGRRVGPSTNYVLDAAAGHEVLDGGQCQHCGRPTGFESYVTDTMPATAVVCWYQYDQDENEYVRGCAA